ncbi:chloroplastic import inner membrane translocase subunit HP30-2-like protein [Tanacetum coccineum]
MGFDMGITSVMKRLRGKEDAQTCMVAGFGAGVMVSLLRGRGLPYAFSYGVLHGLMNVGMFKGEEGGGHSCLISSCQLQTSHNLPAVKTFTYFAAYEILYCKCSQNCIDKNPSPIKAAIVTTINATVAGAAMSLVMDAVFFYLRSTFSVSPPRLVSLNHSNQLAKSISQERMVMACTRGALMGIDAGITGVMKRIRGKEDVHTSMMAGIGAGVLVSLLRGRDLTNASHLVLYMGSRMVKEKFSQPRIEDELFKKTSVMLSNLGLGHYEENFKKEFLTDETLPLLSDRQVA